MTEKDIVNVLYRDGYHAAAKQKISDSTLFPYTTLFRSHRVLLRI